MPGIAATTSAAIPVTPRMRDIVLKRIILCPSFFLLVEGWCGAFGNYDDAAAPAAVSMTRAAPAASSAAWHAGTVPARTVANATRPDIVPLGGGDMTSPGPT